MKNRIDNGYISNAIDELVGALGVKESADCSKLDKLLRDKETKNCLKAIASQLGLPIEINLSFVPKDYKPSASDYRSGDSIRFQSRALARTDSSGRGIEGITAQVSIPNYLPFYGTSALTNFLINVKVSENCNEQPETFIAVMAHELSHVLLHSLMHPQKDNEFYTDLTAMILGLSTVIERGRKVIKFITTGYATETQTTTYGYLSDEQFIFARNRINSILKERMHLRKELQHQIAELRRECSRSKRALLRFNKFLEYLDRHRERTIKQTDALRIVSFHQAGYTDELEKAIRESERLLTEVTNFSEHLVHYTNHALDLIQQYKALMKVSVTSLSGKCAVLDDDVKVLGRYVSLWYRISTAMEIRKA
jgi:hypothetical protein